MIGQRSRQEQALRRHKQHKKAVREAERHDGPLEEASESGDGSGPPGGRDDDIHIVFSTSCNEFQHWQTEVLLNTAKRVGQRGKITHIVVGCEEREDAGMAGKQRILTHAAGVADNIVSHAVWGKSSNANFKLHFAPAVPEARPGQVL